MKVWDPPTVHGRRPTECEDIGPWIPDESGPSWNGTNTRTLISAITKDKNIVHDFKKIIDSKITGKPVHVEELKSVNEPVGTRSKVDVENIVEGRVVKIVIFFYFEFLIEIVILALWKL